MKPKAGLARHGGSAADILLFNERESKIMAKTLKKALALFLAVVMVLSTVGMTSIIAAADDTAPTYQTGIKDAATAQKVSDGTSAVEPEYAGKVEVSKTITPVEGTTNFNVELKVVAKTEDIHESISNPLAVCLVIDLSSSMNDKMNGTKKIDSAKAAAQSFVQTLDENCYVSIVTFGNDATQKLGWTRLSGTGRQTVKNAISALTIVSDTATNMDAGFIKARELFANNTVSEISDNNKVTVVLSDGKPTYAMWDVKISKVCNSYSVANAITAQEYNNIKNNHTYDSNGWGFCENCGKYHGASGWNHGSVYTKILDKNFTGYDYRTFGDGDESSKDVCDATLVDAAKLPGAKYAVYMGNLTDKCYDTYTISNLFNAITGSSDKVLGVSNIGTLTTTLNALATTINDSHSGSDGAGWTVTDIPNSPIITIVPDADNSAITANGIVWNLAGATPVQSTSGNTTTKTYTYTLNYTISLNTEADGFVDGEDYFTSSPAAVLRKPVETRALSTMAADDPSLVATFNNPTVEGTAATYYYVIKIEKQLSGSSYQTYIYENAAKKLGETVALPNEADIFEMAGISADDIDVKYSRANTPVAATIGTGTNEILYKYNRVTTSVKANYYYLSYGHDAQGNETTKAQALAAATPVVVYYPEADSDTVLYVGDDYSFTAPATASYSGKTYSFITADSNTSIRELAKEDNEINLYYENKYDAREAATLVVNHYFKTITYQLVNGKFVATGDYGNPVKVQDISSKSTVEHDITVVPSENSGFTANNRVKVVVNGVQDDTATKVTLNGGENTVDVYFEKTVDNRTPATVTVKHNYVTNTTTIENGQRVSSSATETDTDPITGVYVGESLTIQESAKEGFTSDSGNAAKLNTTVANGDVIELFYNKTVTPKTATVTVNHIYTNYVEEVVTKYEKDDEGNNVAVGYENVTRQDGEQVVVPVTYGETSVLYVGEAVNIVKRPTLTLEDGTELSYNFNAEDSGSIDGFKAGDAEEINLYYNRTTEPNDVRTDVNWDVTHSYAVNFTSVNENGVIATRKIDEGTETTNPVPGKVGDTVSLTTVTTHNNNEYSLDPADTELSKVLQDAGNNFALDYIRDDNNLIALTPSVTYEYYVRYMSINENNEPVYGDWALVEDLTAEGSYTAAVENTGDYANSIYAGQYITAASGATDEYDQDISDTAYNQQIGENNWSFTYKYGKSVPLSKGIVTVKYNYKDITIAIDGTESLEESSPVEDCIINDKYVGQSVTATSNSNGGYELVKVLVNGVEQENAAEVDVTVADTATTVEYFYKRTHDNSKSATYTVDYIYETYDYKVNGEVYLANSRPVYGDEVESFATRTVAVNVAESEGFTFTNITFNGQSIFEEGVTAYAPVLDQDANTIVVTYRQQLDTRQDTEVNIKHVYTKRDTFKNATSGDGDPEYVEIETIRSDAGHITNGIWVDANYAFTDDLKKPVHNDLEYSFVSVDPESLTLAANAVYVSGAPEYFSDPVNVFTATYVREYSTQAKNVVVNHNYYTTGVITGEQKLVKTIVDDRDYLATLSAGDSFEVDPMTELDGVEYECTSETLSFTLNGDVNYQNVFDVDYNRVVPETIAATPGTITHEYYVVKGDKKTAEGNQTTTVNGNIGETVTVEPVLSYNGNTYKLAPNQDVNVALGSGVNDITLQYVRNEYEVKFNSNGGTEVESQSVKESEKAVKPADPTRDGYSFNGWFSDSDLTKAYSFEDGVTADTELFAGWNVVNNNNPTPVNPTPNYPTVYPTVPQTPAEVEEELPEDEVPLAELPEEELPEDEVPLAAAPSVEEEELEEDLVPLGDAPATGDSSMIFIYAIVMLVSACGLVAIALTSRKKREEDC